jgi:hypothetical protein
MGDKKEWLEKVLDDASADVKSWPNWMKETEERNQQEAQSTEPEHGVEAKSQNRAKAQYFG